MSQPSSPTREAYIPFAAPDIDEADVEAVTRVLRGGWLTTGEECILLEGDLADYLSIPHVVSVSSCTAALEIALAYLDLNRGARVGVPTWTFASTALSAVRQGANVVLLDVDPRTLNVSGDSLAAALESGLDAIVPVHFGGVAVEPSVLALSAEAGVPVIEDAAHALGASDARGLVAGRGTLGAAFSFYATKNLTSGEGGALATEDGDLAAFARSYRLHGMTHDAWARYRPRADAAYDLERPGIKANLADLLAALARSQLARFDDLQSRRRAIVRQYRERLVGVEGLSFVPADLDEGGADHLLVVVLPLGVDRGTVAGALTEAGIGWSVHFTPLHRFTWFKEHAIVGPTGTTHADAMADRVLSLPLHPQLTVGNVDRACDTLITAIESARTRSGF